MATYIDSIGSRQMTFVTNLFSHRPWFELVPDTAHRLVVSGYGTYANSGDVNSSDYVTAARTPDGSLAIAYLPAGQSIVVDLARMAGHRVRAQWYDPTDGAIGPSPARHCGAPAGASLRRPGRIKVGTEDWVLVLTAA